MKKLKFLGMVIFFSLLIITGCFKRDNLEGIEIITTTYPLEFVTNYLYGEHSIVNSIYPDGTDTFHYPFTKKQLDDFSKKKLFIYNRITEDKDIALNLYKQNEDILIIDATYGMDILYHDEELWLNPSNLLMIAQNIKNGLHEYMTNSYLEKEISKKYDEIKISLSELDAEFKLTAENANRKKIIVNSDVLKYLEKYGFEVVSLDNKTNTISEKVINEIIEDIQNKNVQHIFLLENTENSDILTELIEKTKVETYIFRRLDNISETERKEDIDYFSIMNSNIELLKNELY